MAKQAKATPVEDAVEQPQQPSLIILPQQEEQNPMRTIGLIGEVNEEKASEIIYSILALKHQGKEDEEETVTTSRKPKKKTHKPFELYVSTHGGSAADMFAIYDVMRMVKNDCDITTIGVGKVMSAGVLILAAGTRGKRKIGKNCRVMIHSVLGGNEGPLHDLENEMSEIRWTQERYIKALIEETKLTKSAMDKLLKRHVNVYLSPEEAVKYGIADEVV